MILMTKLKNEFQRQSPVPLEFYLSNIAVNGVKRGCSGFIRNPFNNSIVYISTEASVYGPLKDKVLVRYARHLKDYGGDMNIGHNQWPNRKDFAFVPYVLKMLSINPYA